MASEKIVTEIIRRAGYEPIKEQAIIVSLAAANLSDKIIRLFKNEFFVLQICEDSIVLVPFGKMFFDLKKKVSLQIPFSSIHAVRVNADGFNYRIELDTDDGTVMLSTQQKELSEWRTSGFLASGTSASGTGILGAKFLRPINWHRKNLDATLDTLRALCG